MSEPLTTGEKVEIAAFTLILGLMFFFAIVSVCAVVYFWIWGVA